MSCNIWNDVDKCTVDNTIISIFHITPTINGKVYAVQEFQCLQWICLKKMRRAASISLLKFTMNLQKLMSEFLEDVFQIWQF